MNRGGQTTILLLEDNPEMRDVLYKSLEGRLSDAEILEDGSIKNLNFKIEVARKARASKGKPFTVDFIIADQVKGNRYAEGARPEWGLDFMSEARERFPRAIRILISAQTNMHDTMRILSKRLVHHFQLKTREGCDTTICGPIADVVVNVLAGNYSVLNIDADDARASDALVRTFECLPRKTQIFANNRAVDAEEITKNPRLLESFKNNMARGRSLRLAAQSLGPAVDDDSPLDLSNIP